MRLKHLVTILALLALAVPASSAHAGGVVSVCDEAHLLAALAGGGTVTFSCSGTIILTATIKIAVDITIDGSGQAVTISGNDAVGVFIVNSAVTLNLDRITVIDGNVYRRAGGGVFDFGTGGGIFNNGTVTVSNSTVSSNSAGRGGGIDNHGTLIVSNSTISNNGASEGGGIENESTLIVSNSTFSRNGSQYGGAIDNGGTATVRNCAFSGNGGVYQGGAIYNGGALTVSSSTFSGNLVPAGYGGGINNDYWLTVDNSTFFGNQAIGGGGISSSGWTIVTNSTFSGNTATSSGGGIAGAATLKNSIVANNPAGGNCSSGIDDGGGNLSYPDTSCPGINGDPLLGPLQNNVGPTETMALGPGSAAIDAGIDAICAAAPVNNLDQRGIARPWGKHCDIGAVEQAPLTTVWLPTVRSK